jgi:hypothetical protein
MKYPLYILASIIIFASASLGVASAANDNGFPGILEKLDELKASIAGLTLSVPSPLDVNVVSPDPLDVRVTNTSSDTPEPKLIKILDNVTIPPAPSHSMALRLDDTIDLEAFYLQGYKSFSISGVVPRLDEFEDDMAIIIKLSHSLNNEHYFPLGQLMFNETEMTDFSGGSIRAPYGRVEVWTGNQTLATPLENVEVWLYLMP